MEAQLELNDCQKKAHDAVLDFWKSRKQLLTMGGLAGTGKTTLIAHIVQDMKTEKENLKIAFCAFTGKASNVLRWKLEAAECMGPEDFCGTIHSLIYNPKIYDGRIVGFTLKDFLAYDLIIVDEASMMDEKIFKDLAGFRIPILAVGDHGQLPPVMGNFNLMAAPEIRLEKIMRQAENHPIIRLSMMARHEGYIPCGEYGQYVRKVRGMDSINLISNFMETMILCAKNKTRVGINQWARKKLGHNAVHPVKGEKVICLKNNRIMGIYNGMTGTLVHVEPYQDHWFKLHVNMEQLQYYGITFKHQFGSEKPIMEFEGVENMEIGDLFDWAYCMTVHKAQGSEAERVVLIEERMSFMSDDEWRRWLYTGVTRSRERLLIIEGEKK